MSLVYRQGFFLNGLLHSLKIGEHGPLAYRDVCTPVVNSYRHKSGQVPRKLGVAGVEIVDGIYATSRRSGDESGRGRESE
jgi:hypothetical protein